MLLTFSRLRPDLAASILLLRQAIDSNEMSLEDVIDLLG